MNDDNEAEYNNWNKYTEHEIVEYGEQAIGSAVMHYKCARYYNRIRYAHGITNIIERIIEGFIKIVSIVILIAPTEWFAVGDIDGWIVKTILLITLTAFDLTFDLLMGIANVSKETFEPERKAATHKSMAIAYASIYRNIDHQLKYSRDKRPDAQIYGQGILDKYAELLKNGLDPPSHIKNDYKHQVTRLEKNNNLKISLPFTISNISETLIEFSERAKLLEAKKEIPNQLEEIVITLDKRHKVENVGNNEKEENRKDYSGQDQRTMQAINDLS